MNVTSRRVRPYSGMWRSLPFQPLTIMTSIRRLLVLTALAACTFPAAAQNRPKGDAIEEGLRQAFTDYQKGDHEAVSEKLREILKQLEEKTVEKVAELLPKTIEYWQGGELMRDDLGLLGGGVSLSRTYTAAKREATVKVVKDSPLAKQLIPLLGNNDLIALSGRKTHRISGQTAVMEGDKKLQMAIDGRILLEVTGNQDAEEKDLVAIAKKLDLAALAKMK